MSIEYRSTWLRAPDAEDISELARSLARFGSLLGPPAEEIVGQLVFPSDRPADEQGPDVTLYADAEGVLVSFHAGTRAQRAAVVQELDRVLNARMVAGPLEED